MDTITPPDAPSDSDLAKLDEIPVHPPDIDTAILNTMGVCDQTTHASTCSTKSVRHVKIQVKTKVKMKCKSWNGFF